MRNSIWLLGAALLSACGPAGVISGQVTYEGGESKGIAVFVYGPQSAATVTGDDGKFTVNNLPDGVYVVRATVRGAETEELSLSTTVTQGVAAPTPVLAFKSSNAKVTGTVVMADGSPGDGLTVTAVGPMTAGATTSASGAFTFDNLKPGAYAISVEAKDTREGRVGIGVNATTGTPAIELRLTPVGRFGGTVSFNAMPVANVPVVVTGTNLSTVTDAMGRFQLVDVPTGNQAVLARVGSEPFFRSATAMVTVVRGANPDVAMTLTDDMPKTGTVTGVVTFHGPRTPRDITVTVPGSGVTATPQVNGSFSLTLPVGVWDVVASAPAHPAAVIGRVTVSEGQVQALPGAELSWYRPVWRSASIINFPSNATFAFNQNDNVPWSLVTVTEPSTTRLALVSATTYDFRILAMGTTQGHRISKSGKYAGWYVNSGIHGTVFVYEIGTATLSTFAASTAVGGFEFSTDESALFIRRTGPLTLSRILFSAPTVVETFPATGAATAVLNSSVDRWFVRDATNDVRLVTPSGASVPQVFTQVSQLGVTPTAWALTNCAATCQLRVMSPTSNSPGVQDTTATPVLGNLLNFSSLGGFDNRGDYPCFYDANGIGPPLAYCVRSTDGTHIPLAAVPSNFRLNEAGDRVIWTHNLAGTQNLREEVMPPAIATANIDTTTVGFSIGWLSPTRAYAFEPTGAVRTLHLIKSGVVVTETDIGAFPLLITAASPALVIPTGTSSTWRAYLGDGPVRQLMVPTTLPLQGIALRRYPGGPVTKYAALSFDSIGAIIIDENMGTLRNTSAGYAVSNGGNRSGALEYFLLQRNGGSDAHFIFNNGAVLESIEGLSTYSANVGGQGVYSFLGRSEDQHTIILGSFQ